MILPIETSDTNASFTGERSMLWHTVNTRAKIKSSVANRIYRMRGDDDTTRFFFQLTNRCSRPLGFVFVINRLLVVPPCCVSRPLCCAAIERSILFHKNYSARESTLYLFEDV